MSLIKAIMEYSPLINNLGVIVGATSAVLAYKSFNRAVINFRADHDRSRRAEVLKLMLSWNEKTLEHREAIDASFPGLLNRRNGGSTQQITKEIAAKIYHAEQGDPEFRLRFHILELLNFFEAIAVASRNNIADRGMIETSFRGTLENYNDAFRDFVAYVKECRGYNPWEPFDDLIREWKVPRPPRAPPDVEAAGQ